jgi:hypothetical protein
MAAKVGPEKHAATKAKQLLRAEMNKGGFTYTTLADALTAMGLPDVEEATLRNRVSRGTFSAAFLLLCLRAMGTTALDLG